MLVRLIYASRAAAPIDHELVDQILEVSRRNNTAGGITGALCYCGDVFLQALEGSRVEVNRLYGRLQRDARHGELTLLEYAEIDVRRYPAWSMGKVKLDKVNLSLLLKYSTVPALDPFSVSGKATAAMLEELLSSAAFVARD
ncbi:BLUF domain-containing protein [Chitinimonas koreensis]|uniref:BLUF domain-containing protein n=1 Tax=Chitinimonas koreensis TaxID=356302 RepID=UPI000410324F|nr:BLUF domain-containing protein [Chitinimonas koreensis]QNM97961.1 BLUF domain-containing protein [Chitinimonas koreensis]